MSSPLQGNGSLVTFSPFSRGALFSVTRGIRRVQLSTPFTEYTRRLETEGRHLERLDIQGIEEDREKGEQITAVTCTFSIIDTKKPAGVLQGVQIRIASRRHLLLVVVNHHSILVRLTPSYVVGHAVPRLLHACGVREADMQFVGHEIADACNVLNVGGDLPAGKLLRRFYTNPARDTEQILCYIVHVECKITPDQVRATSGPSHDLLTPEELMARDTDVILQAAILTYLYLLVPKGHAFQNPLGRLTEPSESPDESARGEEEPASEDTAVLTDTDTTKRRVGTSPMESGTEMDWLLVEENVSGDEDGPPGRSSLEEEDPRKDNAEKSKDI